MRSKVEMRISEEYSVFCLSSKTFDATVYYGSTQNVLIMIIMMMIIMVILNFAHRVRPMLLKKIYKQKLLEMFFNNIVTFI